MELYNGHNNVYSKNNKATALSWLLTAGRNVCHLDLQLGITEIKSK